MADCEGQMITLYTLDPDSECFKKIMEWLESRGVKFNVVDLRNYD